MYTSRYVLKIFKKRVVHLLVRFFKAFKKKVSVQKYLEQKLLITSWTSIFMHLFSAYKKYLEHKLLITS